MLIRLFTILTLALSTNAELHATSVTEASNSPESTITNFYRLMSFEAGSRPDYKSIRTLLTDDAIILLSATSDTVELIDADESIRQIQKKIDELGFEDFGLQFSPVNINCKITDASAFCVTVVEVTYPGLDAKPVTSTDLSQLEQRQGRWLATTSALFVTVPDVAPHSILSYPVIKKRYHQSDRAQVGSVITLFCSISH